MPLNPDFGRRGFQGDYMPSAWQSKWCVKVINLNYFDDIILVVEPLLLSSSS